MITTLLIALAFSLVINMVMFVIAYALQSDKLTDISYAVSFVALAIFGMYQAPQVGMYQILLLNMICIWAARLGGFLLYRVIKKGKDSRFDEMRGNFIKFGGFWLLQALSVWVISIPSQFAFQATGEVSTLAMVGLATWIIGLAVESLADYQKDQFSSNTSNKDKWIDEGIWHYSRHPNYFGEICVWVGLYIYCLGSLTGLSALIGLLGPGFITTLLLFVSGVPILEKSADARWGKLKEYQEYKRQTSVVVPLPKR